jgi:hypothetical protein
MLSFEPGGFYLFYAIHSKCQVRFPADPAIRVRALFQFGFFLLVLYDNCHIEHDVKQAAHVAIALIFH